MATVLKQGLAGPDRYRNSVRAMKPIEYLSDQLGVSVFGSGR